MKVLILDLSQAEYVAIDPQEYNRSVRTDERERSVRLAKESWAAFGQDGYNATHMGLLISSILADDPKPESQEPANV